MTGANQPAKPPCLLDASGSAASASRGDSTLEFFTSLPARLRGLCASLHAAPRDVHYLATTSEIR